MTKPKDRNDAEAAPDFDADVEKIVKDILAGQPQSLVPERRPEDEKAKVQYAKDALELLKPKKP